MTHKLIMLCFTLCVAGTACQRATVPGTKALPVQHPATQALEWNSQSQAAQTAPTSEASTPMTTTAVVEEPELLADAREGVSPTVAPPTHRSSPAVAPFLHTQPEKTFGQSPRETRKAVKALKRPFQGKAIKAARKAQALTGLQTAGIIVGSAGLLVALFVSILLGLLMLIGGVIMLLLGKGGSGGGRGNRTNNREGDLQDVVYLKNGSVIRGTIVEQVPNQSLKIQTNDGSVFVYEMAEVVKITKE